VAAQTAPREDQQSRAQCAPSRLDLAHGVIAEGSIVFHCKADRACVHPDHLRLGHARGSPRPVPETDPPSASAKHANGTKGDDALRTLPSTSVFSRGLYAP